MAAGKTAVSGTQLYHPTRIGGWPCQTLTLHIWSHYFHRPSEEDRLMTVASTPISHPPHRAATRALLYRINVAEAKLGVSRSTIYRLVHNGELELVKIGKRSSGITATSLHAMIERNKMPC